MNTTQLFDFASRSFRDLVATLLTDEPVPENFDAVLGLFKSRKSDLGRKEFADRIGLSIDELREFERSLSELAKRKKNGLGNTATDNIACLRLLSWLETIDGRQSEYELDAEIDSAVSEDLSRKQVRALELVIRSLIGERHGNQQQLASYLREIFGDRTVDRWSNVADPDDLLSGTTFSELASIFVNKDEFAHHQKLYEDADVVNLLKERRKTVQSFLEDIRRVRNTLAHNKKVSNIQLSLLDLYYDQLISPVQTGYTNGQTQVNPQTYLEVSDEQVREYFSDLKQDVMSVKDDISELKAELNQQFDDVRAQGDQIASTTRGIDKKLIAALALLIPIALAVGYGIYLNLGTGEQIGELEKNTQAIETNTKEIGEKSDEILANQSNLSDTTDSIATITDDIATTTGDISAKTDDIASTTDDIAATTGETAATTKEIAETTGEMAATTDKIASTTEGIASTTERVADSTERLEDSSKRLEDSNKRLEESNQEIVKTTERVAESSEQIMDSVSSIAESNEKIAQSIEKIQDGFQALSQAGGIIASPKLPQEVYHNARVYEQRGDYASARKSYVKFFNFKLELVDPHLRFQSFLKLQEGLEGAREIYRSLKSQHGDDVTTFAAILLEPTTARTAQLTQFVKNHPKFAPAFYALSREFSSDRLGTQDVGDMADEKQYLEKFLALKEQGEFVKYMLDKSLATEQLKDAQQRLARLNRISDETLRNPVSLSGMMSNSGWMITIQVTGSPKEILYRTDPDKEFKSTGHMQVKNFTTGNLMPNMTVNLETNAGPTTFEIKYFDANGKERGPFKVEFEPASELVSSQKRILEMMPQSWASFRDYDGKTLVYFSHLVSYRNAIKKIWYGIDKETPDTVYKISIMTETGVIEHHKEFDQGDQKKPGMLQENEMPFFTVPETTKFITIKLDYLDGTESEIVRIKR